jgi:hypothetical protein
MTADASGANFGWPQYEGNIVFDNSRPGPHPPSFPMHVYSHNSGGCAVIGGYVVRDPRLPTLANRYLYGDLCTGQLRSFIPRVAANRAADDKAVGVTAAQLAGFGKGFGGVIYIVQVSGAVSRLAPR